MASIYPDLPEITVKKIESGSQSGDLIGIVYLNRPESLNAFTQIMAKSLVEAFTRLDHDNTVKAVILTGVPNKGKAFCAGADLKKSNFAYASNDARAALDFNLHRDSGGQVSLAAHHIRKPIIAAITGHAVGIGITMTLPFDFRFGVKNSKIGFVFAQRGIVPEAASSYFLPKLVGMSKALELMVSAKVYPAQHPSLSGLFTDTFDTAEEVFDHAVELAKHLCIHNSAISMAMIKSMIWRGKSSGEEQHFLDSRLMYITGKGNDSQAAVKGFLEKKVPKWESTVPKDLPWEAYPWWSPTDIKVKL